MTHYFGGSEMFTVSAGMQPDLPLVRAAILVQIYPPANPANNFRISFASGPRQPLV